MAFDNGKYKKTKILIRNDKYLLFDDKFGVSDNHVDVIPIVVINDISNLTKDHVNMLNEMYELGSSLNTAFKISICAIHAFL